MDQALIQQTLIPNNNRTVKPRLLRVTTVPISLKLLLNGQPQFFMSQGFEVLTVSAAGAEVQDITDSGVAHCVVPMTRQITPFQDLKCIWMMVKVIHNFKPNIIHTHTPKAGLVGMLAGWLTRVPVRMHTIAGLPWMEAAGRRRKLLQWVERLTYWCATRVYPNSNELRNFLLETLHFNSEKVKVIGRGSSNGIDVQFYSRSEPILNQALAIRQKFGIAPGDFVFCFVGRLVRDKGMIELIQAFQSLKKPNSWLLLIGHREDDLDPLPPSTTNLIKNDSHIIEAGFQADIRPWLASSNAFVFPSYREGFPNVVMQAACMELPCIVSDINGCREIIQQGNSGYIIPPKNVESLLNAMLAICNPIEPVQSMGLTAKRFVELNFSQTVIWQLLLKEYESML